MPIPVLLALMLLLFSKVESMNRIEFNQLLAQVPDFALLDLPKEVRGFNILFEDLTEYALFLSFQALSDRIVAEAKMRKLSERLLHELVSRHEASIELNHTVLREHPQNHRPRFLEDIVQWEQLTWRIFDKLKDHRLYVLGRYLPFTFETIRRPDSVLLAKMLHQDMFTDVNEW